MRKYLTSFNIFSLLLVISCSTFYTATRKFHKYFENYEFNKAQEVLNKNKKKDEKSKNKLLHFLNNGVVSHMLGNYEESNYYFEKAYQISRSYKINPATETLAYILNPTITEYKAEDHEVLFIHYYKALNYIFLKDMEAALIECRRMDKELRKLKTKYKSKGKYTKDAFIHVLMGLIYQANKEYNDAFIAYRNAIKIYKKEYRENFDMVVPNQLKKDLLYMAHKNRFVEELHYYEKVFGMVYSPVKDENTSDIIVILNNGLGPIKDETSINFIVAPGVGGVVNFSNDEMGLMFPFPFPSSGEFDITNMSFIRVAFPKYVERKLIFNRGEVIFDNKTYPLELAEDINAISFKVLNQRMIWEFSKTLIRLAVKKLAEYGLSKQNQFLGLAAGIFNMATERADTRNWQSLPHSIYYTRLKLSAGDHELKIKLYDSKSSYSKTHTIDILAKKKETTFYVLNSIDYRR